MAKKGRKAKKATSGGINALAPSKFTSGGKPKSGSGRKTGGAKAGFSGVLGAFNMTNVKRAAALIGGVVAAQAVQNQFGAAIAKQTGMPNLPVMPVVGAAGLLASGTSYVKKSGYGELVQLASLGAMVPAGLAYVTQTGIVPTVKTAGYDEAGDVDGYGDDSYGYDDGAGDLVLIGNVDDAGEIGAFKRNEDAHAMNIARKIARARDKGKDKKVDRLQARAVRKGLDDEIKAHHAWTGNDGGRDGIPGRAPVTSRRIRRRRIDSDGDGVPDAIEARFARTGRNPERFIVDAQGRILGRA